MSNLLMIVNSNDPFEEEIDFSSQLEDWNISLVHDSALSKIELKQYIQQEEIYFLLFSRKWESDYLEQIHKICDDNPLLHTIYYSAQLKDLEFAEMYLAGIDFCIIGDARQINLIRTLKRLWNKHWRRVPDYLIATAVEQNALLLDMTLNFIEKKPIKMFNVRTLSEHLKISENQFRIEFKQQFGKSFRSFKQELFQHYEDILLFDKKLKPKEVYRYLNYKNLSAFSRSFKMRHGRSWQDCRRDGVLRNKNVLQ